MPPPPPSLLPTPHPVADLGLMEHTPLPSDVTTWRELTSSLLPAGGDSPASTLARRLSYLGGDRQQTEVQVRLLRFLHALRVVAVAGINGFPLCLYSCCSL